MKRLGLVLLVGSLLALIIVSVSLSNMQLNPGTPFPREGNNYNPVLSSTEKQEIENTTLPRVQGFIALILLLVLLFVLARIVSAINIRKLLKWLPVLVILLIAVALIPQMDPGQPPSFPDELNVISTPQSPNVTALPLGDPPQFLLWLVAIAILFGMCFLGYKLFMEGVISIRLEDQIAQEAKRAIQNLRAGKDFRNVIINCYLQMSHVLQAEQGIERNSAMTAREFERWLRVEGLPFQPVRQLSSLFEKTRYGNQKMSKGDEKTALESLNEIIRYCQGKDN